MNEREVIQKIILNRCVLFCSKGYNQGHRFILAMPCSHHVVTAVTGGARKNDRFLKAEKIECEQKLNDPTTPTTD